MRNIRENDNSAAMAACEQAPESSFERNFMPEQNSGNELNARFFVYNRLLELVTDVSCAAATVAYSHRNRGVCCSAQQLAFSGIPLADFPGADRPRRCLLPFYAGLHAFIRFLRLAVDHLAGGKRLNRINFYATER